MFFLLACRECQREPYTNRGLRIYSAAESFGTGVTLAELLLGQKPHSRLDLMKPDMAKRVEDKQSQEKATHDVSAHSHTFEDGDLVHVLNFGLGEKWIPGKIYRLRDLYLFCSQL